MSKSAVNFSSDPVNNLDFCSEEIIKKIENIIEYLQTVTNTIEKNKKRLILSALPSHSAAEIQHKEKLQEEIKNEQFTLKENKRDLSKQLTKYINHHIVSNAKNYHQEVTVILDKLFTKINKPVYFWQSSEEKKKWYTDVLENILIQLSTSDFSDHHIKLLAYFQSKGEYKRYFKCLEQFKKKQFRFNQAANVLNDVPANHILMMLEACDDHHLKSLLILKLLISFNNKKVWSGEELWFSAPSLSNGIRQKLLNTFHDSVTVVSNLEDRKNIYKGIFDFVAKISGDKFKQYITKTDDLIALCNVLDQIKGDISIPNEYQNSFNQLFYRILTNSDTKNSETLKKTIIGLMNQGATLSYISKFSNKTHFTALKTMLALSNEEKHADKMTDHIMKLVNTYLHNKSGINLKKEELKILGQLSGKINWADVNLVQSEKENFGKLLHALIIDQKENVHREYQQLVTVLIEKGVSVTHKNASGYNSVHYAAAYGNTTLLEAMLKHGDIKKNIDSYFTKDEKTPLDIAKLHKKHGSVACIIKHTNKPQWVVENLFNLPHMDKKDIENMINSDDFKTALLKAVKQIHDKNQLKALLIKTRDIIDNLCKQDISIDLINNWAEYLLETLHQQYYGLSSNAMVEKEEVPVSKDNKTLGEDANAASMPQPSAPPAAEVEQLEAQPEQKEKYVSEMPKPSAPPMALFQDNFIPALSAPADKVEEIQACSYIDKLKAQLVNNEIIIGSENLEHLKLCIKYEASAETLMSIRKAYNKLGIVDEAIEEMFDEALPLREKFDVAQSQAPKKADEKPVVDNIAIKFPKAPLNNLFQDHPIFNNPAANKGKEQRQNHQRALAQ